MKRRRFGLRFLLYKHGRQPRLDASLPLPKKGTRRLFSPPHDFFHTLTILHSWHDNSLFSGSDKVKRALFQLCFPPMSERNRTTRIRFLYTLSQFFSKRLSCKKNILTHTDMISLIFFSVAASSSLIFLSVSFWTSLLPFSRNHCHHDEYF